MTKVFQFLVFRLWRWLLAFSFGAGGSFVGIWLIGRIEFLRQLPHLSVSGIALDNVILAAVAGGVVGFLVGYLLLIRRSSERSQRDD